MNRNESRYEALIKHEAFLYIQRCVHEAVDKGLFEVYVHKLNYSEIILNEYLKVAIVNYFDLSGYNIRFDDANKWVKIWWC